MMCELWKHIDLLVFFHNLNSLVTRHVRGKTVNSIIVVWDLKELQPEKEEEEVELWPFKCNWHPLIHQMQIEILSYVDATYIYFF